MSLGLVVALGVTGCSSDPQEGSISFERAPDGSKPNIFNGPGDAPPDSAATSGKSKKGQALEVTTPGGKPIL